MILLPAIIIVAALFYCAVIVLLLIQFLGERIFLRFINMTRPVCYLLWVVVVIGVICITINMTQLFSA